jgi:signal transduction histidine kinase
VLICACGEWAEDNQCMHSSYILKKNIIDGVKKADKNQVSTLGIYKFAHYVSAKAIDSGREYFVFATAPLAESRILINRVSRLYYMWAIIPLTVMIVAIYIITYKMTKPIKSMSEAARAIASGDFSKRVPVTSDDEIGELAASFNMMTNSLSRLESTRKNFVANVSHELRTPMTTIGGFIDGILDGTIDPKEHKYYLNIVSSEVKRLTRLVNNMLSVARLESEEFALKREKFDFFELLCTIMIGQEQRIDQKRLEILGLDSMEGVIVNCDKDLIYQSVYNLVDNAIKFTDVGGKIDFQLAQDAENLIFTIENTGKGIPEKELPFVFERFYKIDKSRSDVKSSTGLGLYIVNKIVSAHKGKILVTSKENEFTAFKIILPKEI